MENIKKDFTPEDLQKVHESISAFMSNFNENDDEIMIVLESLFKNLLKE
jgi:hypothetical protein